MACRLQPWIISRLAKFALLPKDGEIYSRAQQQAAPEPLAAPLCIKKNFLLSKFKKKDIKLYLTAPEPPDVAPVMPWVAGP